MSEWKAKRFWKTAKAVSHEDGFGVQLDSRSVRTPHKSLLVVPTLTMAEAIMQEWDAQQDVIDPRSMPVTCGANSAIDKLSAQRLEVIEMLAGYGDSDLLCYRAAGPAELKLIQAQNWDPLISWAAETLGAQLNVGEGVMHVQQDPKALANLKAPLDEMNNFALAGFHDLVTLSGSLILALAVVQKRLDPIEAWQISRVDEEWQVTQWGEDEEARSAATRKQEAFVAGARFYQMSLT